MIFCTMVSIVRNLESKISMIGISTVFGSSVNPDPVKSGTFSWIRFRDYLIRIQIQAK